MLQTLVLHHSTGTTTDVELYTQPLVTFANDKVLVKSCVLNMEYPNEDIVCFTYKGKGTAITTPKSEVNYSQSDSQLIFHNIKSIDDVAIFKSNGIRVPVSLIRSGNDVVLTLSQIPHGVYLLSVNGRTSKFTRL